MIRTGLACVAAAAMCLAMSGCEGGSGDSGPPPKGGALRPAPETPRRAPGPGSGEEGSSMAPAEDPGAGGAGDAPPDDDGG
jgi:hypothetical protein